MVSVPLNSYDVKWFTGLLIAAVLAQPVQAAPISSQSRTEFKSETQGLPVGTEIGQWVVRDEGKTAELIFKGGHLLGTGTTFVATWVTPFTPGDETPSYEGAFEFSNHNELGRAVELVESFRYRDRGERWSPWRTSRSKLDPGFSAGGSGTSVLAVGTWSMQFQWRLKGRIIAPTYLEGHFEGRVN